MLRRVLAALDGHGHQRTARLGPREQRDRHEDIGGAGQRLGHRARGRHVAQALVVEQVEAALGGRVGEAVGVAHGLPVLRVGQRELRGQHAGLADQHRVRASHAHPGEQRVVAEDLRDRRLLDGREQRVVLRHGARPAEQALGHQVVVHLSQLRGDVARGAGQRAQQGECRGRQREQAGVLRQQLREAGLKARKPRAQVVERLQAAAGERAGGEGGREVHGRLECARQGQQLVLERRQFGGRHDRAHRHSREVEVRFGPEVGGLPAHQFEPAQGGADRIDLLRQGGPGHRQRGRGGGWRAGQQAAESGRGAGRGRALEEFSAFHRWCSLLLSCIWNIGRWFSPWPTKSNARSIRASGFCGRGMTPAMRVAA